MDAGDPPVDYISSRVSRYKNCGALNISESLFLNLLMRRIIEDVILKTNEFMQNL